MKLRMDLLNKIHMKTLIKFMLVFICFERVLESLGVPHALIFLLDALNIILLLNILRTNKYVRIIQNKLGLLHMGIFAIAIVTALLNGVGIILIVWASRNLFRFYVFFVACLTYLNQDDVEEIYKAFDYIFWINIVVMLLEYLVGYRQDELGGIFGTVTGANSYSNIFLILIFAWNTTKWFSKKIKTSKYAVIMMAILCIAVITETKILFFEIPAIIGIEILIKGILEGRTQVLLKGFVIILVAIVAILVGAKYLAILYPSHSNSDFLSIDGLKYILTRESGYTGYGDLNRLTAIKTINRDIKLFNESFMTRLFGIGFGAAEYSSFSGLLQSDFYIDYQYLHYYWLSHAWMYIECGYIGVIGYILGFYSAIPYGIKIVKKSRIYRKDSTTIVTGMVVALLTVLLFVYNQSLRIESAYIVYFAIAAIFIGDKKNERKT